MNESRWLELMKRLGINKNIDTYNKLLSNYSQKHRCYHNVNHIHAVLEYLDQSKHLAHDYNAIELALWFHDAIYKVFSSTNELNSANWASTFLEANGVSRKLFNQVHSLIMTTLHNATPTDSDEKLMVDIDLSILGCTPRTYQLFESSVRKEYKSIPSFIYKKKRKEILTGFLERERIYSHQYFYEKLEATARSNISSAIQNF